MRKFKTAEDNRTNYIYYFDDGSRCVITPGENGENTTIISQLHAMDDAEVDADRREDYHCPVHYDGYHDGDGDDADDRNPYLEDEIYNPLQQILTSIAEEERSVRMEKLKVALSELTDKQKDLEYIVRRLTPTECARLQGFPDWWCDDLGVKLPSEEELTCWAEIFETHRKIVGTSSKPKTRKQIFKWLQNPHSDSAEYKMWGNGVALPNVVYVLTGIVYYTQNEGV